MDDEQRQIKDAERASAAQQLMNNPLLLEAFSIVEKEIFETWKRASKPEDRDRLWQSIGIIERVKVILGNAIANGTVAKSILADLENKRRRAA